MNLRRLATALIALVLVGLVVPTGADFQGADDAFGDEANVLLTPHPGPNGEYASFETDGNLSVDLTDPSLNIDAQTGIEDVFLIANNGDRSRQVWLTHNASGAVSFYIGAKQSTTEFEKDRDSRASENSQHELGRQSIEGFENNVTLESGETQAVSVRIDTSSDALRPGDFLLKEISLHTVKVKVEKPKTEISQTTGAQAGGGAPAAPATPTPSEPTTPSTPEPPQTPDVVDEEEGVEVEFDETVPGDGVSDVDPDAGEVQIQEISVEELDSREGDDKPPRAIISHGHGDVADAVGEECPCVPPERLQSKNIQSLIEVGQSLTLSGFRSLVGTSEAVDSEKRIVKAVDVTVPEDSRDRPATVRMAVRESKFGSSDPERARIGHLTEEGWQLLPTRVVSRGNGVVILEARTPGFSPFAAFADNQVKYSWEVDGERVHRDEVTVAFDEPGLHNATLTVTDAFGRSNNATYRILANDRPDVTIETVGDATPGAPTTLRANVTNEVGNVTVEWMFEDGTRMTGMNVTKTFDSGAHPVRVTVEDEYGATTQVEQDVAVGVAAVQEPFGERVPWDLPSPASLLAILGLSFALVVLARWLLLTRPGLAARQFVAPWLAAIRRRPPRVTRFDSARVDLRHRRFEIGHLRVEDPDGDLETVDIRVIDERGNEVGHKTIDVRGQTTYEASPEIIPPRSRVYVREDDTYTVRVSVEDARDLSDDRSQTRVRSPVADPA